MNDKLDRIWNQIDNTLNMIEKEELFMAECLRLGIDEIVAYRYLMGSGI